MHFRNIQMLECASSFVSLGWVTICDFQFKRTENHKFTNNQYKPACGILSLLDILMLSLCEDNCENVACCHAYGTIRPTIFQIFWELNWLIRFLTQRKTSLTCVNSSQSFSYQLQDRMHVLNWYMILHLSERTFKVCSNERKRDR